MSQETVITTVLRSGDFTCPSCVGKIESRLETLDGVDRAEVHFNTGRIKVDHNPEKATSAQLVQAVADAGFDAKASAF